MVIGGFLLVKVDFPWDLVVQGLVWTVGVVELEILGKPGIEGEG